MSSLPGSARTAHCDKPDLGYRIGADVNIQVSSFFRTMRAADWCFENYTNWRLPQSEANFTYNKLMHDFRSDLEAINQNQLIPDTMRYYAGRILKFLKVSAHSKTTTPQYIYNNCKVDCSGPSVIMPTLAGNLGEDQQPSSSMDQKDASGPSTAERKRHQDQDDVNTNETQKRKKTSNANFDILLSDNPLSSSLPSSSSSEQIYKKNKQDQYRNHSLNDTPGTKSFLIAALKQPLEDLRGYIWTHGYTDNNKDESINNDMIRHILTDFYIHCHLPHVTSANEVFLPIVKVFAAINYLMKFTR
ncbi:unnamed protein product [Absidia cylindrospora]